MPKNNSNSVSNERKRSKRSVKALKGSDINVNKVNDNIGINTNDNKLSKKRVLKNKIIKCDNNNNNSNKSEGVSEKGLICVQKRVRKSVRKSVIKPKDDKQLDINSRSSSTTAQNCDNNNTIESVCISKDENSLQNNTTLRRSNRVRKATQLYSQEVKPKNRVKTKQLKTQTLEAINEKSNQNNLESTESEETSDEIKAIINSLIAKKSNKKRKSIGRKSIGKSKFRLRNSLNNYKKLNFVEKGNLEILHKKLGLISKRLSVIPESQEWFEDSE